MFRYECQGYACGYRRIFHANGLINLWELISSRFRDVIIDKDDGMRPKLLFYSLAGFFIFSAVAELAFGEKITGKDHMLSEIPASGNSAVDKTSRYTNRITIFICGNVMTGRGIDQVLPHPSDPTIYKSYMKSA